DIRKPHLSSLIVSNQISRDKAIDLLKKPLYNKEEMNRLLSYVSKKLEVDENKLNDLIHNKNRKFSEFSNWRKYQKIIFFINRVYKFLSGQKISVYS
ncbi:MAG: ExsB family protein, partial [Flavobacteriales bacterium]|nr:ExsB family protein [Flavobacteriales bacterium]